jgi:hypothetical protein
MPKSDKLDLQKHTLNLYRGDWDELRALYPNTETSTLIREIVRSCIINTKAADPEVTKINVDVKV